VEHVVLVDGENVRRSEWPNIPQDGLVSLVRAWAEATGVRAVVVFDGRAPEGASGERLRVVGTGPRSADDWIARAAAGLARDRQPYRLVTSDRELRARAGRLADDIVGGGTFAGTLRAVARGKGAAQAGNSP
jgi:predicted RNA-binding protein with PIN domain